MTDILIVAIAKALSCEPASLLENSGLGKHSRWDSLGHISVVTMLEREFAVDVTEENVALLVTVAAIRVHLDLIECEKR